jgi:cytochrome c-type biogenesis protein CcmE
MERLFIVSLLIPAIAPLSLIKLQQMGSSLQLFVTPITFIKAKKPEKGILIAALN